MDPHDRVVNAVLKGGGPRTFTYLGAIAFLEEQGYKLGEIRGTSAGAIIGSLLAVGLSAREIAERVIDTDFDTFRRGRITNWFPVAQTAAGGVLSLPFDLVNLALYGGFYSRRALEAWMCDGFRRKNVDPELTFEDLPHFRAYAMDISNRQTRRILEFSKDTTPNLSVIKAVSMSSSVPVIFEPERYEGCLVVDGAWADNLPIQSFAIQKMQGTLDVPVVVMTNQMDRPVDTSSSRPFYKLLYLLISALKKFPLTNAVVSPAESLLDAQDEIAKELFDDWAHFVDLNSDVGVLHFGFSREKKEAVVKRGWVDMKRFWQSAAGLRFRMDVFCSHVQRVLESMSADSKYRYRIRCEIGGPDNLQPEPRDTLDESAPAAERSCGTDGRTVRPSYPAKGVSQLTFRLDPRHEDWSYESLLASVERHVYALEEDNAIHTDEPDHASTPGSTPDAGEPHFVPLPHLAGWQSLRRQYGAQQVDMLVAGKTQACQSRSGVFTEVSLVRRSTCIRLGKGGHPSDAE